ncbi:ABC transporter ATP-binding protein [Saccharomonospora saliphila]|uniref:ABC transporter ATP-binding protein n=1 Tax=Saccharomonospora saliphila TaxID=369829 RepID=UPI00036D197A|nr:ABC transporter ATP-binding protein [Saccharomonospora saliphila]
MTDQRSPDREQGLAAHAVTRVLGGTTVVDGVTVAPPTGRTTGLLGPNGSGKTTLLRLLAGVLRPTSGTVTLDSRPLGDLPRRDRARRIAMVAQQSDTQVPLTVEEVVRLGRVPHRKLWASTTRDDDAAVRDALAHTGMTGRQAQHWHTLSGGERQRVQIARALAQRPRELLLDEPTNHLDVRHQLELLQLVSDLPCTSVVALHDLNLAATYCDHVVVLDEGRIVREGTPHEVLTEDLIAEVYDVRTDISHLGPDGRPHVRFLRPASPLTRATGTVVALSPEGPGRKAASG